MSSTSQTKRLVRELEEILCDPISNVTLWINPNHLYIWYFRIQDLSGSFQHGQYLGRIQIKDQYLHEAPVFIMDTPNGRFAPGQPICIHNFASHPELYKSEWTIASIIRAFVSLFQSRCYKGYDVGNHIICVKAQKIALAQASKAYNSHRPDLRDILQNMTEQKDIILSG